MMMTVWRDFSLSNPLPFSPTPGSKPDAVQHTYNRSENNYYYLTCFFPSSFSFLACS